MSLALSPSAAASPVDTTKSRRDILSIVILPAETQGPRRRVVLPVLRPHRARFRARPVYSRLFAETVAGINSPAPESNPWVVVGSPSRKAMHEPANDV